VHRSNVSTKNHGIGDKLNNLFNKSVKYLIWLHITIIYGQMFKMIK